MSMLAVLALDCPGAVKRLKRGDLDHSVGVSHARSLGVRDPASLSLFSAAPALHPLGLAAGALPCLRPVHASGEGVARAPNTQERWVCRRFVAEEGWW